MIPPFAKLNFLLFTANNTSTQRNAMSLRRSFSRSAIMHACPSCALRSVLPAYILPYAPGNPKEVLTTHPLSITASKLNALSTMWKPCSIPRRSERARVCRVLCVFRFFVVGAHKRPASTSLPRMIRILLCKIRLAYCGRWSGAVEVTHLPTLQAC